MNTVSFGSTFKIKGNQDYVSETKVMNFCEKNDLDYSSSLEVLKSSNRYSEPVYRLNSSIIAPDKKDNLVETYLKNRGIKFKKINTSDLLDKKNVESRIKEAPKGMQLVKVNVEKLDELISNQDNNIHHCEKDYDNYYRDVVDLMIKSGDKLPATTLYIEPSGESVEDTINYIENFGSDSLNKEQLICMFNQSTDDPDHCVFFGLRDLGMDKVPVYVNKDTLKIGSALGVFE